MKTRTTAVFLIALFATVLNLSAITYEDLAGVYECKRVERFTDHTARYTEWVVIRPDGFVMNLIAVDGIPTLVSAGFVAIDEKGNFLDTPPVGRLVLKGKGKRLEISLYWPAGTVSAGAVTMTIKGQRTQDRWEDWMVWLPL